MFRISFLRMFALSQILVLSCLSPAYGLTESARNVDARAASSELETTIDELDKRLASIRGKSRTLEGLTLGYGILSVVAFFAGTGLGIAGAIGGGYLVKKAN